MINIKWEKVFCHLCGPHALNEPVLNKGEPIVNGQFGYAVHPVICQECGLVYLNPRWSKGDYDIFYREYYDKLYRLEIKPDYGITGVIKNMRIIWERIRGHTPKDIKNILDIGCGSGYGLKYLQEKHPSANIFGIESSLEGCNILQGKKIKAKLITGNFDSNWEAEYPEFFDLIVLRHVVEHMLTPVNAIKKIRSVLKKDGMVYFSTPDMMNPRLKLRDYNDWVQYWFRPVHSHYYCRETLLKTLECANIYPILQGNGMEEIWVLAGLTGDSIVDLKGGFQKQSKLFNHLLG